MTREEGNRRLVEPGTCIYVDSVGDVFCRLCLANGGVQCLVLSGRGEEQATIWSKGETPKERSKSFVVVDGGISDTRSANTANARGIWHDSWQRHRWSRRG